MQRPKNLGSVDEHSITVRDLRLRFGAPDVFTSQCSCGWVGEERHGRTAERLARQDGVRHLERERLAQPARSLSPS